jgi:hypothetical protein
MPMVTQTVIHPGAAGIDLAAEVHYVAVPAERDPQPVRSVGPTIDKLGALADWLQKCGIRTVAMEAIGSAACAPSSVRPEPSRPPRTSWRVSSTPMVKTRTGFESRQTWKSHPHPPTQRTLPAQAMFAIHQWMMANDIFLPLR